MQIIHLDLFEEISDLDISKLLPLYVTTISNHVITNGKVTNIEYFPSFWTLYKDKMLYVTCFGYKMDLFESFHDWDDFNYFDPGKSELNRLLNYSPKFHDINYNEIIKIDEYLCQHELDFINVWNRDKKINLILQ